MPDVSADPADPADDDVVGHIKTWDVDALMRMPPSKVESVATTRPEVPTESTDRRRRWRRPVRSEPDPAR